MEGKEGGEGGKKGKSKWGGKKGGRKSNKKGGRERNRRELTTVYLTSPEPSKNCYNLFTLHSIKKTLTPLESSQLSRCGETLPVKC